MKTLAPGRLALGLTSVLFLAPAVVAEETRTVEAIHADIETSRAAIPEFDPQKGRDEEYVKGFLAERNTALETYIGHLWELYETAPADESVPGQLVERWQIMAGALERAPDVLAEAKGVAAKHPTGELALEGHFWQALVLLQHKNPDNTYAYPFAEAEKASAAFVAAHGDEKERVESLEGLLGRRKSQLRREEALGKPLELAFQDAISGQAISMADLRGKVVVIDFWATWCGPCVRDMPHMKELYAKFKDQGVEFVGVSLDKPEDQGGLAKLKSFVEKNEIGWPQYYQGKGWQSEFSSSWGINSIPALFVVDQKGNIVTTEGRGQLEELLPKLLAVDAQ